MVLSTRTRRAAVAGMAVRHSARRLPTHQQKHPSKSPDEQRKHPSKSPDEDDASSIDSTATDMVKIIFQCLFRSSNIKNHADVQSMCTGRVSKASCFRRALTIADTN